MEVLLKHGQTLNFIFLKKGKRYENKSPRLSATLSQKLVVFANNIDKTSFNKK